MDWLNSGVTADALVMTTVGPRRVGDLIGSTFTAVVFGRAYSESRFVFAGAQPVFRVVTDRGYQVRASMGQKILVERWPEKRRANGSYAPAEAAWVECQALQPGDDVLLSNQGSLPAWGDDSQEEFDRGWLVGSIVGDGGHNPERYPTYLRFWGEHRETMARTALEIVKSVPYDTHRPRPLDGIRKQNEASQSITVASRALDYFANEYLVPQSKTMRLATETSTTGFTRGFICGFFDADGSVQGDTTKGCSVRLGQSDAEKLRVVQRQLLRIGIGSTLYENRSDRKSHLLPDGRGGHKQYQVQPQHELCVTRDNVYRFAARIGFKEPAKLEALSRLLSNRKRTPYMDQFTATVADVKAEGSQAIFRCCAVKFHAEPMHAFDGNGVVMHSENLSSSSATVTSASTAART